jgi:hypothetical protein
MDVTTLQIVKGPAAKVVEPNGEEFEVTEPITDEVDEPETTELSVEELEEICSELSRRPA